MGQNDKSNEKHEKSTPPPAEKVAAEKPAEKVEAKKVLVNNLRPSVWDICLSCSSEQNPLGYRRVRLMPGVNELDAADWAQAVKNPQVGQALEDGHVDVVGDEIAVEEHSLDQLEENKAVRTVRETVVLDTLEKWAEEEKRPKVVKALKAQLEEARKPLKAAKQ